MCWFPSDALENIALSRIDFPFDQSAVRDPMYRSIVISKRELGTFQAVTLPTHDDFEVGRRLKFHLKGFFLFIFSFLCLRHLPHHQK
jgi:hypothetical protein